MAIFGLRLAEQFHCSDCSWECRITTEKDVSAVINHRFGHLVDHTFTAGRYDEKWSRGADWLRRNSTVLR